MPAVTGGVVTIEVQSIPTSGNSAEPGVVFPAGWANVITDVQIYGTGNAGARLSEDMPFALSAANLPWAVTRSREGRAIR